MLVACGSEAQSDPTATPTDRLVVPGTASDAQPLDATLFGVAGLIPPNWPTPSDDDYATLFASFAETGPLVGVYLNWRDAGAPPGEIPQAVELAFLLRDQQGITPVIAIGATEELGAGQVGPTVDWADPLQRQGFIDVAVAIATTYEAPYLAIGGEVNRLWESSPVDFGAFVDLYRETYDAVKAARPETMVFTIFQLEFMKGEGFLSGHAANREPQWDLVDEFEGKLDLIGFTTYPFFDFHSPADIPADYYTQLADRFDIPIAFTEIGWPSAPLSSAPDSPYGGSPEEQVDFIERLPGLWAGLEVALALWAFPNDVGPSAGPAFETVALRDSTGDPKPALAAWQSLAAID